jgi:uncharacterized protein Yka (UPF0111/DUF47 family)
MEDKFEQELSKIHKKLDKILNLQTKIAKTLHLIPVTEKEEKAIQILQRKNMDLANKVYEALDDMQNIEKEKPINSFTDLFTNTKDVYSDVIGDDFLGGDL